MNRREFLRTTGVGAASAYLAPCAGDAVTNALAPAGAGADSSASLASARVSLPRPQFVRPDELTLTASGTRVSVGEVSAAAWSFNGSVPAPPIQVQRGERARIELRNRLREPTIIHWHGLHVPEAADGHPRLAVPPNQSYAYDFTVDQRAAMYWYHPHAHARTGAQVYQGLAGIFVVRDAEEAALGLPYGDREIFLLLQDRRAAANPAAAFTYEPAGPDMMMGLLGDTPFGNGVPMPTLDVEAAVYRIRVLNGSNARIYRLALSTGSPLFVIGNDGGLLAGATRVESVDIAPGERVDLLADLSAVAVGARVMLRSLPFALPGGMGAMGGMGAAGRGMGGPRRDMDGGPSQGTPMDALELFIVRPGTSAARPPARLAAPDSLAGNPIDGQRTFRFSSRMMRHTINGREFDMSRVDERVPLGSLERWTFANDDMLPHPVHLHATHFEVVARHGGRGTVFPWERGLKDTVLVLPGESVDVLVRFERHRGVFLLHCHNLEHEDAGMMANIEIV